MKRNKLTLVVVFVCLNISGMDSPDKLVRTQKSFNTDWKFILADYPDFRNPEFNDMNWRILDLPHDWSIEGAIDKKAGGSDGFFPQGVGWYRKHFKLPDSLKAKKIAVQFDGVYMNSEVWINGNFLGRYPYGYTTFQYDITEYLKIGKGEENVIAVRVDHSLFPSTRWYNGSGIYRNVHLIATNYIHFHNYKGVYITTPFISDQCATIHVQYNFSVHFFSESEIEKRPNNKLLITKKLTVRSTVISNNGIVVAKKESEKEYQNLHPDNFHNQEINMDNPVLWSIDTPVLYYLRSEILLDGIVVDDQITPFGIRKLEFIAGKGMFVNGKSVKLKGVCLHHEAGSFGSAVPMEIWHYRLQKLKKMGCNAIRTSHHPFTPEFYNLCDTMGFFILDEAFDEWTRDWDYNYTENPRGKSKYGYHLYFNQWHEYDLKAMIWRDRNHPSVVMYSIGNEIPDQMNFNGGELSKKLVAICHTEDPSRPVTSGCNLEMIPDKNEFIDVLDISGYNYIDRVYPQKLYLPEYLLRPEKLCVGTETTYSINNFLSYRDNPYVLGEFLWVGIDYLGESGKYPVRGVNMGLLDMACNESNEYYLRKSYWSDQPTVHIAVSTGAKPENEWSPRPCESKWNWILNETLPVYVYTNCDEIELVLNEKTLGTKIVDKNLYYALWNIKYEPGNLEAIGYINKEKVTCHTLYTTGNAYQIFARPEKITLSADGKDITLVEIAIQDSKGNPVLDEDIEITVNVSGEAKLIGLDSGEMNYEGLFKTSTRKTYHGKLLAAIQSTKNSGPATIKLESEKLKSFQIQLQSR